MGVANSGNLQATGTASVAIGENVQALANNAMALGFNVVNPNANSFMVGFNASTNPTLTVTSTGVGIGTSSPFGGGLIVMPANTGNVGLGSLAPGQLLDVQGTIRTINFTMSNHAPIAGYVMTASDSAGDSTWSSPGGVSGWTVSGANVYETGNGNVGIGTTLLTTAALTVMDGNVGIGTWVPAKTFSLTGDSYHNGNIGIGTTLTTTSAMSIMNGNVGVGTWIPADIFQVGAYKSSSSGFDIDNNGNVGMGTTLTTTSVLSVMSGNVGVGTWVPAYKLDLVNNTSRARTVRRVVVVAAGATPAINTDITDLAVITGQSVAFNMSTSLTGTPNNGDLLEIRITDNSVSQTITWGASFASTTTLLPSATTAGIMMRILVEWNSTSSQWECVGST